MKSFTEYEDINPCPCGSQKSYGECCKLKQVRWGYDENQALIKQLPITPEIKKELNDLIKMFEEYYGRKPGKEDYVFSFFPIYQISKGCVLSHETTGEASCWDNRIVKLRSKTIRTNL
ncbi:SEC-C domain-containing protein [Solibaculum mannosilyticum]|uniref:SEC-C domain-containing protein n=1 Tax=Solibaculum mannosilyticum TaxID=2780922 RepID=UPI0007A809F9|nr:hypothetical protein BN3661_01035 [Eubacteriaceae bacterium CHKCI005]